MRRRVTFSRNLTLSLSRTCRCYCKYCAFATHRPHLHEPDEVLALGFHEIFHEAPASDTLLSVVHALGNMVVELAHRDGSVVRALMSKSAVRRADDQFALATFQDLTAQLWIEER